MQPLPLSSITGKWGETLIDRIPPHNIQAEESILGSCLIGGVGAVNEAREIIDVSDFYNEKHRRIWETIIEMADNRSEEHTSELQSRENLVCRLLLEKKKP